jgi:zinc D-Ala-D-Ala carboxypeptidase
MDGSANNVTNKMVFDYIKDNLEFDQLIWEFGNDSQPDWVHVSYESTGKQRKQILRATKINGKSTYKSYGKS